MEQATTCCVDTRRPVGACSRIMNRACLVLLCACLAVTVSCRMADGLVPDSGPRRTGDGYYECVVRDPEGNRVEIAA